MPYVTPLSTPVDFDYWRVLLPDNERIRAAILGQLLELIESWNWEEEGGISVSETNALCYDLYNSFVKEEKTMLGSLVHFVTDSAPSGILPCDGTQYLRVDYPELYAVLPASLIVDPDNFIVPDIEDKFLFAAGSTYSPEDEGGAETHQLTVAEMPSHSHNSDYPLYELDTVPQHTGSGEHYTTNVAIRGTSSAGSDTAHENMPPFVAYKLGIVAW